MSDTPDVADSVYRRSIDVVRTGDTVEATLQDHHHHFSVAVNVTGDVIETARTTPIRYPWTTCVVGAAGVASLDGLTLDEAEDPRTWGEDRTKQCIHVADLTLIAIRHARDTTPLHYLIEVAPAARRYRTATMRRNDQEVMRWELDGQMITGPAPFHDLPLDRAAFLAWVRANLTPDQVEAAMALRRAVSIALGNAFDLDSCEMASDVHGPDESCHTYTAAVAFTARRNKGSTRAHVWA